MTVINLLNYIQVRLALSWISIRAVAWIVEYNIDAIPLVVLTIVLTIVLGVLIHQERQAGTEVEDTSFTPIDTKSPRIDDDVLDNNRHIEIMVSTSGVNMNQ